ncbi:MAG: SMC-Scp complex subunit ScpB [Microbacterium sp.]
MTADSSLTADSAVTDAPARSQEPVDIARRIEAILLVVDEPQSLVALPRRWVGLFLPCVRRSMLVRDYDGEAPARRAAVSSCARSAAAGACTCKEEHDDLRRSSSTRRRPAACSRGARNLAVIAYKQPVTRSQVAAIRAVTVDSVRRIARRPRA